MGGKERSKKWKASARALLRTKPHTEMSLGDVIDKHMDCGSDGEAAEVEPSPRGKRIRVAPSHVRDAEVADAEAPTGAARPTCKKDFLETIK